MYEVQYRVLWYIKCVCCFLEHNRHFQGPKRSRFPKIGFYAGYIYYRTNIRILQLFEKYSGPQDSWGWEGSALDGVDADEYLLRIEKKIKKQKNARNFPQIHRNR